MQDTLKIKETLKILKNHSGRSFAYVGLKVEESSWLYVQNNWVRFQPNGEGQDPKFFHLIWNSSGMT